MSTHSSRESPPHFAGVTLLCLPLGVVNLLFCPLGDAFLCLPVGVTLLFLPGALLLVARLVVTVVVVLMDVNVGPEA